MTSSEKLAKDRAEKRAAARARIEEDRVQEAEKTRLREALGRYVEVREAAAEGRVERAIFDEVLGLRRTLDEIAAMTERPIRPVRRLELGSSLREATSVALLSDVHAEEKVRRGETPVANEYDLKIAAHSLERYFAGVQWLIEMHRSKWKIRNHLQWLGGDLMTGHIHDELVETTQLPPGETVVWLRDRLVAGIDRLLEELDLERLILVCSYGNHGRTTHRARRAMGYGHSWEWLLYQVLADHYARDPRVEVLADRSAHQYVSVYDFDLHFHHGDETSYQGGVGGIMIPLNKAIAQWDRAKSCHYHHFGHWHQYLDSGSLVVNGSVIGFNAYAMSIKASPEPPQQAFYLLDSKRGKTCKSPIWVRERGEGGLIGGVEL